MWRIIQLMKDGEINVSPGNEEHVNFVRKNPKLWHVLFDKPTLVIAVRGKQKSIFEYDLLIYAKE